MAADAPVRPSILAGGFISITRLVESWGELAEFTGRTLKWLFYRWPRHDTLTPIFYQVGVRSVPVVGITGLFIGMVLAVQSYGEFMRFPPLKSWMGAAINGSVLRELGPVLAATMLAGRVGSAIAAELGTMRVTEQIDALTCLGVNPMHYLVVPRFLACALLIPLLTIVADFMGVMGGALMSVQYFGVESYQYWSMSQQKLGLWDIFTGVAKSVVFGAAIAIISCHRGFSASAGAEGVGKAATDSFVVSFVAILVIDFFMAMFFNKLYAQLWPQF
jgi:phospholipid/cholesterol/gamma-HCH transport system permease protein